MEYQLEIWTGKSYEPVLQANDPYELREAPQANGSWRITRTDRQRPLKPKGPRRSSLYRGVMDVAEQARRYAAWLHQTHGKNVGTVHIWEDGKRVGAEAAHVLAMELGERGCDFHMVRWEDAA